MSLDYPNLLPECFTLNKLPEGMKLESRILKINTPKRLLDSEKSITFAADIT